MISRTLLASVFLAAITSTALAADWPQWRGPDRDGVSKETGLASHWPAEGPKLLWQTGTVGTGFSSFAVVGDTFYTLGTRGNTEYLFACSVSDGSEKWAVEMGPLFTNQFGDGPRSTPTVDGGQVFALGSLGKLLCVDAESGKTLWSVQMKDFGGQPPMWAYSESVLVDGDKVVCSPGGNAGAIVALDRKTGKLIWQSTDLKVPTSYCSIIAIEHEGKRQYVQMLVKTIVGIDPESGATLWSTPFGLTAPYPIFVPTPIFHDGQVYITNGYKTGCIALKLDGAEPSVAYENKLMENQHGGVIRIGDYLYGYSDARGGAWVCQNFTTGEVVWTSDKLGKGSLTAADGKLFLVTEKGLGPDEPSIVVMIDASPTGWNELGLFTLEPQSKNDKGGSWSHPVVANGKLFLRDHEMIYCYDIAAQ